MRDFSKPPYEPHEMAAVYIGICHTIGEPCSDHIPDYSELLIIKDMINSLSNKYNSPVKAAVGDAGQCGIALQSLIDTLIGDGITTIAELEANVFPMFNQLPESPFIDRITGEKKFNW